MEKVEVTKIQIEILRETAVIQSDLPQEDIVKILREVLFCLEPLKKGERDEKQNR